VAFQRLPESIQTLYAELLEQTIHAEAEAAVVGAPHGSFVSKTVKGGTYWYLQRMEGDRKRQHYLGKDSPALLSWMEEVKQVRARSAADEAQRAKLCGMLAAGGAAMESAAVVKVLLLMAQSGVFRMGGVLVGTQAFIAYGNMLGVRFEKQAVRTQDVDIAQDRAIGIALSREASPINVQQSLTGSGLGFFAVPALDPKQPSTSFKIRGRELRVDFLTPLLGRDTAEPIFLPALGVSAHPLRFLDYLIENPVQAVILGGSGILVNVPQPSRFAFHTLQTKTVKDRRQAGDLLEVLLDDRPVDLVAAWESLLANRTVAKSVLAAIRRLPPELQERLGSALSDAKS
jgi:hypothetical protein